ncbi:hypothetical protein TJA_19770 [Thermus sp. LT1-2-5]|uniref:hypothetical protein n=1 Tax=Thermus sp. LT1-2-5 TaxID=3026935 RepID=UPI0030EA4D2A
MRILADVSGRPVRAMPEGGEAAFGDAMVAAVGLGMEKPEALSGWLGQLEQRRFLPQGGDGYRRGYVRYRELYRRLSEWFAEGEPS